MFLFSVALAVFIASPLLHIKVGYMAQERDRNSINTAIEYTRWNRQ